MSDAGENSRRTPVATEPEAADPAVRAAFAWTERPVGGHQQLGYLLAGMALERAARTTAAHRVTTAEGATVQRGAAEQRMVALDLSGSVFDISEVLTDVAVWRPVSPIAQGLAPFLGEYYRREYGLRLDLDAATITVDPAFDAVAADAAARDTARHARTTDALAAARQLLADAAIPAATATAARAILAVPRTRPQRRRLRNALQATGIGETLSNTIIFTLSFLTGRTAGLDLLADSPVQVDPAEEARGMIGQQLASRGTPSESSVGAPARAREIAASPQFRHAAAALPAADRRQAENALAQLADGAPGVVLWPAHVSRRHLDSELGAYSDGVRVLRRYARALATDHTAPVQPIEHHWMTTLAEEVAATGRDLSAQATHGHGLTAIERRQIAHTMTGALVGNRPPALLFVGEHYKQQHEVRQHARHADQLRHAVGHQLVTLLTRSGFTVQPFELDPRSDHSASPIEPDTSVLAAADSIYHLALGTAGSADATPATPADAADAADELQNTLARSAAPPALRESVGELLADYTGRAAQDATRFEARDAAWEQRIAALAADIDSGTASLADLEPGPQPGPAIDRTAHIVTAALPAGTDHIDLPVADTATATTDPGPAPAGQAEMEAGL